MARSSPPSSFGKHALIGLGVCAFFIGGGYLAYQEWQKSGLGSRSHTLNLNETEERFDEALEKRRWNEAEKLAELMRAEGVNEAKVVASLALVKQRRIEEGGQQVAFLVNNAKSALEAGQLSEAEGFCREVEQLQEDHPELPGIRSAINESKIQVRSGLTVRAIERAVADEEWAEAEDQLAALIEVNPDDARIPNLQKRLELAQESVKERRAEADLLVARARELDRGTYSPQALALVKEAMGIYPSKANRDLYQKMSTYGKVIKVPGDHATITEALKQAQANDRVFVGKGTYQESLIIPTGIELVGAGRSETIIECPADLGAVISLEPSSEKIRISSLALRHRGLVNDEERFPAIVVDGAHLEADNLQVTHASGHGIAVINGGKARISASKFADCGWDGVSVTGLESHLVLSKVNAEKNLHHGVDFWDGASGEVSDCVFSENGRSGFLAIAPGDTIRVARSRSERNREVGFFFSEVSGVKLTDCVSHQNLLGGMFFDHENQGIELTNNRVTENGEAGIVIEQGAQLLSETGNAVTGNAGKQIWRNAVFPAGMQEDVVSPPPLAPPLEAPVSSRPQEAAE